MFTSQLRPQSPTNNVITLFDAQNKSKLRRLTADQVSGLTKQVISDIEQKIKTIHQDSLSEYQALFCGSPKTSASLNFAQKMSLISRRDHRSLETDSVLKMEAQRVDREREKLSAQEIFRNPWLIAPVRNCNHDTQLSYLTDFSFVKRRITKAVHSARLEHEAKTRSVGGKTGIDYASDETLKFIRRRDQKNAEFLKRRSVLVKETGQLINLYELQQKQAERKFNESYYLIKNLESIACDQGLMPHMLTLTAPANYHPNPIKGKSSFDQTSARDSQKYLSRNWAKLRALLSKRGTPLSLNTCFGVRTAELHRDGCIHWHILMFIAPSQLEKFQKCLDFYFTSRQADVKTIEGVAGATYVLKYIGKTVDTSKLDRPDLHDYCEDQRRSEQDLSTIAGAERVRAGIRAMGVRQMQYYGIEGSLTLFRTINKINQNAAALPDSVQKILLECRMHNRSSGNTKITNFEAFKNLLCNHLKNLELIYEESINKHGAPTKRIIGVRFLESMTEIMTHGKYEVILNRNDDIENDHPTTHISQHQTSKKSQSTAEVTVISIYPREAERTKSENSVRPTASQLLKLAKTLNPNRYIAPYLAYSAPITRSESLTYAKICSLMSML